MPEKPPTQVTLLLDAAGRGDSAANEQLWSIVYEELRHVAHRQMASERDRCTLDTTVLVHETYLRLGGNEHVPWVNRRHFFAATAQAMRRIRVDDARKRRRVKRGGGERPVPLGEGLGVQDAELLDVLALDEALRKLEREDPRKAEVVMLRHFSGLSVDETAEAMELSPRTIDKEWRFARAWLHRELG